MEIVKDVKFLDLMEAAVYPAVSVNFNGKEIIVIAKRLSFMEIKNAGEFSLLDLKENIIGANPSIIEIAEYVELQHEVLKKCMINPTYEQAESLLNRNADVEPLRARLEDMDLKFHLMSKQEQNSKEGKKFEEEYAILEMRVNFIFPQDFLVDMFLFATSQDISDIKLIQSEEILYNAALLAEKGNCRASDILCSDGDFTEFNKYDIDMRAAVIKMDREREARK